MHRLSILQGRDRQTTAHGEDLVRQPCSSGSQHLIFQTTRHHKLWALYLMSYARIYCAKYLYTHRSIHSALVLNKTNERRSSVVISIEIDCALPCGKHHRYLNRKRLHSDFFNGLCLSGPWPSAGPWSGPQVKKFADPRSRECNIHVLELLWERHEAGLWNG